MTQASTQETQSTAQTESPSVEDQIAQLEVQRSRAAKTAAASPSVESIEAVDHIDTQLGKLRKVQLAIAAKKEADRAKRQARLNDATLRELAKTHASTRQRAVKACRRVAAIEAELREQLTELDACGAELTRVAREAFALGGCFRAHTSTQLVQVASGHAGSVLGGAGRNVSLVLASGGVGRAGGFDPLTKLEGNEDSGVLVSVKLLKAFSMQCPEQTPFEAGTVLAVTKEQANELTTHGMAVVVE